MYNIVIRHLYNLWSEPPISLVPTWHHTQLLQYYWLYSLYCTLCSCDYFYFLFLFIDFRERENHRSVVLLFYAFIGCFLYVPRLGIKPTTLMHQDNAVTKWITLPELYNYIYTWQFVLPKTFHFLLKQLINTLSSILHIEALIPLRSGWASHICP